MKLADLKVMFLGEVDVPPEHREAISLARRERFHRLAPLAAAHGLLNAAVLTLAFWAEQIMPLVFVWCYTSAVLVLLRVREARRATGKSDGAAEDARILRYTWVSGGVWGLILWALITSSGPEHLLLLGVMTASILCVGALLHSSYPKASLGYSLLVGCGASLGLFTGSHMWAAETAFILIGCIAALQRFAAMNGANYVRRHLNAAALKEAKETVDLLLNDFEAHSADWLWRVDGNGRVGRASQRFIEATGLAPEHIEGGHFLAFFSP